MGSSSWNQHLVFSQEKKSLSHRSEQQKRHTNYRNHMQRIRLPLIYVVVGLLIYNHSTALAQDTCTATPLELSSSCGGVCDTYQPCLVYNVSQAKSGNCSQCVADAADSCSYYCFNIDRQSYGDFSITFLIPFGSYQSEQEIYERSINANFDSLVKQMDDKTGTYPWANNNLLTTIDTLPFPTGTTEVILAGGTDWKYAVRGKVVNVNLAPNLFSNTTSVTKVSLISMNLEEQIIDLPTLLPSSVTSLNIGNTLLSSFPMVLSSITTLEELKMNSNYITSIDTTETISSLTYLGLADNELGDFEGYFPKLESLNLGGNNLTKVPAAVFQHKTLKNLWLDNNPLTTAKFTSSQVEFFRNLDTFDLTASSFTSSLDCDKSVQVEVQGLTVCVTDASGSTEDGSSSTGSSSTNTSGSSSGGGGGSSNIALIIGIIAGVVVLVLGIVIACLWYRRQRYKDDLTRHTGTGGTVTAYAGYTAQNTAGSANSKANAHKHDESGSLWSDSELLALRVSAEYLQDVMKIGSGAYGVVWLVKYRNTQLLASKRIQKDHVTHQRTQDFVDEIKLVAKFDHPNIVKFIGAAWTMESDLQALFEYMKNGDLREYLVEASTARDWNREKVQIAIDVVEALVYVHSFQPPLVHRDLKSRNVLLSGDMRAKLTDFGVSRFRSVDNTMTIGVGTSRWLAPEVILGSNDYGQAADIYSFGVLLSELDSHRVPYADARSTNGNVLPDVAILQMVAAGSLRPTFHSSCPPEILSLADRCLAHRPEDRPTAPQVAYAMRTVQRTLF